MQTNTIRFSCVGCGVCCKGRLIPLTVSEAEQWLSRGHDIAVILEAFNESTWPTTSGEYAHSAGRSVEVLCGDTKIRVIAIFAGKAIEQCPNLRPDNLCGIYEERPLVCRIYPMEINPFIELRKEEKVCPPEVWELGEILCTDGQADPALDALITLSRQADKSEAQVKVTVCAQLNLSVASWKGDALAVYFPEREIMLNALLSLKDTPDLSTCKWKVRVDDATLRGRLEAVSLTLDYSEKNNYIFHSLQPHSS
ncbi:YkgJ family cysteine cluster protein [Pseudomonas nunensis]|uniref:YkgJ family cysteine cluster protein n=1 Tax=Pseudomonas nunensis TaxID=2961896 RepID=UPI0025B18688|nr:YkgJ family cysteine cluster protein [Pseudomonas nunensis]MDN3219687.1 YkgJ family cysteine cluster protein [Pseudomonas nunensis]